MLHVNQTAKAKEIETRLTSVATMRVLCPSTAISRFDVDVFHMPSVPSTIGEALGLTMGSSRSSSKGALTASISVILRERGSQSVASRQDPIECTYFSLVPNRPLFLATSSTL